MNDPHQDSNHAQGSNSEKKHRRSSKKPRLMVDEKQEIIKLHKNGHSNALIAEYIGCSRPTVIRIIREHAAEERIGTTSRPSKKASSGNNNSKGALSSKGNST